MVKEEKIKELISYVYKSIPYYKQYFSMKEPESLEDFPIISKSFLRDNIEILIRQDINYSEVTAEYTTGTTGIPLKCIKNNEEILIARLHVWKWRSKCLKNAISKKMLILSSKYSTMDEKNITIPLDVMFGSIDASYISIEDINEKTPNQILDYLVGVAPEWIVGTPSALVSLAKRIRNSNNWSQKIFSSMKCIELISEMAYPKDRKFIEDTFNCKTVNNYGAKECWPIACECRYGNLHIFEEHVNCEIINKGMYDDKEIGEIVITTLNQKIAPLVRYNLGDLGAIKYIECECGKKGLIIDKLSGRIPKMFTVDQKDYSTKLFFSMFEEVINKGILDVKRYKVIQKQEKVFKVMIEAPSPANFNYIEYISKYLKTKISKDIDVKIEVVDELKSKTEKWAPFVVEF